MVNRYKIVFCAIWLIIVGLLFLEIHSEKWMLYTPDLYNTLIVVVWVIFMMLIIVAVSDLTRKTSSRFLTMFMIGFTAVTNSYLHMESKRRITMTYIETKGGTDYFIHHTPGRKGGVNITCKCESSSVYFNLLRKVDSCDCGKK